MDHPGGDGRAGRSQKRARLNELKKELLEVIYAFLPVTIVIVLLQITLIHMPLSDFIEFLLAVAMSIVGLALFLFGVKFGLLPLGEALGSYLPGKGFAAIIVFGFLLGFVVTVAEPDVRIFAAQINSADEDITSRSTLILAISLGVGISVIAACKARAECLEPSVANRIFIGKVPPL
jgi:hypothetical protein